MEEKYLEIKKRCEFICRTELSTLWGDPYYNNLIRDCANAYPDCYELVQHLNEPFKNLSYENKIDFAKLVMGTWERVQFCL